VWVTRRTIGSLLSAIGLVIVVWRGVTAAQWYGEWQRWRVDDPSGAELYELNFRIDTATAVCGAAIAGLGMWLRRRP
jgi:hypothetical protein